MNRLRTEAQPKRRREVRDSISIPVKRVKRETTSHSFLIPIDNQLSDYLARPAKPKPGECGFIVDMGAVLVWSFPASWTFRMGHALGQWRRHSESLEERRVKAGSRDYSCYFVGKKGNGKLGEIMVACWTSSGPAAEPKEVGGREEEIAFGTGVSPLASSHVFQSLAAKRAPRDASCMRDPDQCMGLGAQ